MWKKNVAMQAVNRELTTRLFGSFRSLRNHYAKPKICKIKEFK